MADRVIYFFLSGIKECKSPNESDLHDLKCVKELIFEALRGAYLNVFKMNNMIVWVGNNILASHVVSVSFYLTSLKSLQYFRELNTFL